jgi:hypothetical protein
MSLIANRQISNRQQIIKDNLTKRYQYLAQQKQILKELLAVYKPDQTCDLDEEVILAGLQRLQDDVIEQLKLIELETADHNLN